MDTPPTAPSPSPSPKPSSSTTPTTASEQARIRRERREAKIRASGSARLSKITGVGGGRPPPEASPVPSPPTTAGTASASPPHQDPAEVDISTHFPLPPGLTPAQAQQAVQNQELSPDQFRRMMAPFDDLPSPPRPDGTIPPTQVPFPRGTQAQVPGGGGDDPMLAMLQQMMAGGGPGVDGGAQGDQPTTPLDTGGLPPGFAEMMANLSGGGAGGDGNSAAEVAAQPKTKWVFPILHFVFALSLGLYCAVSFPLSGTKAQRLLATSSAAGRGEGGEDGWEGTDGRVGMAFPQFLAVFLTLELVLQSSRFVLSRRLGGGSGVDLGPLAPLMGFVPPRYRGLIEMGVRYGGVWQRLVADVGVVVFCVGMGGWVRGVLGGGEL